MQTPISSSGLSWASPVNQLNESEVVNGGNDSSISLKPGNIMCVYLWIDTLFLKSKIEKIKFFV